MHKMASCAVKVGECQMKGKEVTDEERYRVKRWKRDFTPLSSAIPVIIVKCSEITRTLYYNYAGIYFVV